jgi:hypothetical protein
LAYGVHSPFCAAQTAIWLRRVKPSLRRTCTTCLETVSGARTSRLANLLVAQAARDQRGHFSLAPGETAPLVGGVDTALPDSVLADSRALHSYGCSTPAADEPARPSRRTAHVASRRVRET